MIFALYADAQGFRARMYGPPVNMSDGEHVRVDRRWLEKALKPVILDWTKRWSHAGGFL